jgi:hypothetical protein
VTTVQQFIDRVRRDYLTQGHVEARNKLAASIDADDTALTFTYDLGKMQPNTLLSVGLEDMYVWSTDEAAKTADVDRGIDGSSAASHTTTDIVRVAPRWTDNTILRAVNSELDNLYAYGLYKVGTTDIDYTGANIGYDLDSSAEQVYLVQAQDYSSDEWIELDGWAFERNQDTDDFASGRAIFLRNGANDGRPVRVTWFGEFTHLSTLAQDVATVSGLHAGAEDVLAMGAAIGLLVGREAGRNFHEAQGNTRRAEEVPPGAEAQGLNPIVRHYERRRAQEVRRLTKRYPYRTRR